VRESHIAAARGRLGEAGDAREPGKSPAPADEPNNSHKQRRSDYRPNDRKALAPDSHKEQVRQIKRVGKPDT